MPATGKRGSGDLAVPGIMEDATERKRVLNVLAQRRYRKRKKDRLHTLQLQVEKERRPADQIDLDYAELHSLNTRIENGARKITDQDLDFTHDNVNLAVSDNSSPGFLALLSTPNTFPIPPLQLANDPFAFSSLLLQIPSQGTADIDFSTHGEDNPFAWPTSTSTSDFIQNQPKNASSLSDQLQLHQSSTFTFPDDHIIEIPSLKLLNAAIKVALRLNVAHVLWDLTAISPFYQKPKSSEEARSNTDIELSLPSLLPVSTLSSPSDNDDSIPTKTPPPQETDTDPLFLPPHLYPTRTQLLLPHHPILDILPWPSTRDKLIQIFNLPIPLRPKSAQDPISLLRLAYDMEDESGEGVRIQGNDPFEPAAWEIGQVVFERWWWAFESGVVERCDRARRGRGERGLRVNEVG
ncbi:hypothetical protein BJX99DRAFT_260111 [Aspergillus californicus]